MSASTQPWFVYILECADGTLYTGITTDLERRLKEHQTKHGAKYTKARGATKLVYTEAVESRSAACLREAEMKSLTRQEKLTLCNTITN